MPDLTAQRTLVKSPPELWSEVSELESLAKHLGELGEIRITKVEPESTVAWEGELISGTVELEQSGWGTKVTFNVTVPEPEATAPVIPVEPEPEPEPVEAEVERAALEPKLGFWARLRRKRRDALEPDPIAIEPEPTPAPEEPEPEPQVSSAVEPAYVQKVLDGTLDALGQAHHRPFSRG
jgi:hypothetical protein